MQGRNRGIEKRIQSLRRRIVFLSSLRKIVAAPKHSDISERQWHVIELKLSEISSQLLRRLREAARRYLPYISSPTVLRILNSILGQIELELTKAVTFFDTFLDMLTQRLVPRLGSLLTGCDILALDALGKEHAALRIIEPPLVFCDRGFGASILREGISLPDGTPSPMPLIQIPYSRLESKYDLTSIIHETGHEAMVRLDLVSMLPKALRLALQKAGAPKLLQDLFSLWSSEIGPDFWTFCNTGVAQSTSIREILSLPPRHVFNFSWTDPHPPPYLRVLLSFEWCRQLWGKGPWDEWEYEWLDLYPIKDLPLSTERTLILAKTYLPTVSRAVLYSKFKTLNWKRITDLFNLSDIAPWRIERLCRSYLKYQGKEGLSPCIELAVLRYMRDNTSISEITIDKIMTNWLIRLKQLRKSVTYQMLNIS